MEALNGQILQKSRTFFLRRSASLKPSVGNETFKNYRAKTGHDSKYGKARLNARITDLGSEVEIGQTEDTRSPLVVMSARADKRFSEDLRVNEVDMNRAYKKTFRWTSALFRH